jgi:hypothetical protein
MSDVDNFLFGGTGKAAKFEEEGDQVSGIISDCKISQQTSMDDNTPLTWPDGSPRMQLVITLQTELHEGDDDDGVRRLYAKGGRYEVASGSGSSMKDAIGDAVKRSGSKTLDEGGTLTVAFTGLGKKTNRGYSAPKLFKARYEAPKKSVSAEDLFETSEPF